MKRINFIIYVVLSLLIFECNSSKSIHYANKNISKYKLAYKEIESNNFLGKLNYLKIDSLSHFKNIPNLNILFEKKLINKENSIYIDSLKNTDFYINSYSNNFFISKFFGDVYYTELIAYDPQKEWLSRKNNGGVINDYGISEIVEIEKDWFYIKYWYTEE